MPAAEQPKERILLVQVIIDFFRGAVVLIAYRDRPDVVVLQVPVDRIRQERFETGGNGRDASLRDDIAGKRRPCAGTMRAVRGLRVVNRDR